MSDATSLLDRDTGPSIQDIVNLKAPGYMPDTLVMSPRVYYTLAFFDSWHLRPWYRRIPFLFDRYQKKKLADYLMCHGINPSS